MIGWPDYEVRPANHQAIGRGPMNVGKELSGGSQEGSASVGMDWRTRLAKSPPELVLVISLSALVALFAVKSPVFLSGINLRNILLSVAVLGLLAAPQTMLVISANVDLSVGSLAALSGILMAHYAENGSLALGVGVALFVGLLAGAVNGWLVTGLGVNALIVTLGGFSIFRGLAKVISNGQTIRIEGFRWLGTSDILGVPTQVVILLVVVLLSGLMMKYTVFGRSIYALGSNPQAARLAGIRVKRNVFILFVATGFAAAFGGLILTSQLRAASGNAALGLELSVVAAVVLGGASLEGGRGSILGALLGVCIIGTLNNGLTLINVSSFWQDIARGAVLVTAVGVDQLRLKIGGSS